MIVQKNNELFYSFSLLFKISPRIVRLSTKKGQETEKQEKVKANQY